MKLEKRGSKEKDHMKSQRTYWNNRLVQHDGYVGIHECFYSDNGEIVGCTEDCILVANDKEDMVAYLEQLLDDVRNLPVLKPEDLPQAKEEDRKAT